MGNWYSRGRKMPKPRSPLILDIDEHFWAANNRLGELIELLPRANEIAEPKRHQLAHQLKAGRAIFTSSQPDRTDLDNLLVPPLNEIARLAPGANVGKIAKEFLGWLTKVLSE
jgi:hypothetical protein